MKRIHPIIFLLFLLLLNFIVKASEVTVKGFVKLSNGTGVPGVVVKIVVETPCIIEYRVTTNKDGFYQEKIKCSEGIKKLQVSILCGTQAISLLKEVPATNVVEANLTMCSEAMACTAKFSFERLPASATQKLRSRFNSITSETKAGDAIVERNWNFGDGETGTGVDPIHNYAKPGVYEVCLTIKTAGGCTSTKCLRVEIRESCTANFSFEIKPGGVKFNSSMAVGGLNDPIKNRTWNFGDGSPLLKGNVDPIHAFPRAGTYTVCLIVVTGSGCEAKECKQVVIPASNTAGCLSQFSFEHIAANKYRFNSGQSKAREEDKIVERQWEFRDGSPTVKNNENSIVHEFSKPGLYEVCLKIRTSGGCESRICLPLKVEERASVDDASVSIVTLYPTPFHKELKAMIYSKAPNVKGTVSIVDVYGQVKITKQVLLSQGYNPLSIETSSLLTGPYFFKITTAYGTKSRAVYKQ